MADTKNVVITIKEDKSSSNVDNSAEVNKVSKGDVGNSESNSYGMAAFKVQAIHFGETALNEAVAWGMYYWNKELMLNDDYVGQRNKAIAEQMIGKTISYASSAISGATYGMTLGGPIGAILGLALGVGKEAAATARENFQAMDQQNIMLRQMNAQLDYTRQRAGWSLEAASIGEDL